MNRKPQIVVAALYKFVALPDYAELRAPLLTMMMQHNIKGTLLLAPEGLNGTVAGIRADIDALLEGLKQDERLRLLDHKESYCEDTPFLRAKVKLKKEIVTMGVADIDPTRSVGTYVDPQQWNDLVNDPEVTLVDTRNEYEVKIGTFKNAINPHTNTFREFPEFVQRNLNPQKNKKIAMFCTGGIRCEKSTAYLKEQGFDEVYHLKGGILKYLETVPEDSSTWEGECFVFDERVAVDHQLNKGHYEQCNACRMPITIEDQASEHFVAGISCPHCFDQTSDEQKQRYAERQKQVELAQQRHVNHIGDGVAEMISRRRKEKQQLKEQQRKRQSA
ncbi:MAG: rhodanese-related sulfurtransferase [Gammaproteobacteria bacterium]